VSASQDLAHLFRRDLGRLKQEIAAFPPDDRLWQTLPGIANSAGNLALHLEGNLREYIGRQLGQVPYQRNRPLEFSAKGLPLTEILARMEQLEATIPDLVAALTESQMEAPYPENVLGEPMSTRRFLLHLHGHLQYHTGQVNYLRRIITA